jgi:alcohol dehydrogenase class IV
VPSFVVPTETVFGWGCAAETGPRAAQAGHRRALLVTDRGVRDAGLTRRVEVSLRAAGIPFETFDAVSPNPRDTEAEACAAAVRETGAGLLVAVGGGSVMDAAKAAGIVHTNGGRVRDWSRIMGGARPTAPCMPLFALPTTTGTGSETSGGAVITFDFPAPAVASADAPAGGPRKGGVSPAQPDLALLDPALVAGLPTGLLAASGLDALTHAVESYVSLTASLFTRSFSAQAIRTLTEALPEAVTASTTPGVERGPSMETMLYAANIAGRAMLGGLGQVHALSHVVSAVFDTPHGYTNAVLLTSVLEHHQAALRPLLEEIAALMGAPQRTAPGAIAAIARLRETAGAPARLRDLGVPRDGLTRLAADAALPEPNQNPGPGDEATFLAIYERAW